jgi:hypothetical protein
LIGERPNEDIVLPTPRVEQDHLEIDAGGFHCKVSARATYPRRTGSEVPERHRVLALRGLDAFAIALASELEALGREAPPSWKLSPWDEGLRLAQVVLHQERLVSMPVYMGGTDGRLCPEDFPLRVDHWVETEGIEGQYIGLAFAATPEPGALVALDEALRSKVQRAADRAWAETAAH